MGKMLLRWDHCIFADVHTCWVTLANLKNYGHSDLIVGLHGSNPASHWRGGDGPHNVRYLGAKMSISALHYRINNRDGKTKTKCDRNGVPMMWVVDHSMKILDGVQKSVQSIMSTT